MAFSKRPPMSEKDGEKAFYDKPKGKGKKGASLAGLKKAMK
jgi:hypothetical protein